MTERGEAGWNEKFVTLPPGEHMPDIAADLAGRAEPVLAWRNELGGQTWRLSARYLKWNPRATGIDLALEIERLHWLQGRHPAPIVIATGEDEACQWMLTAALPGESVVDTRWQAQPECAVVAIAQGLRRLHALPVDDVPSHWRCWATREPAALAPRPPVDRPVLLHGDACAPNTLVDAQGRFLANVDMGAMAVGDRWADLAVAAMSLGWNYGPGWDALFYQSYDIAPDAERIAWYHALWELES